MIQVSKVKELFKLKVSKVMRALAAGAVCVGLTVGWASAAEAATGTGRVIADPCLNLRQSASSSAAVLGCIPKNTTVTIQCTASGSSMTGPYGATKIWDKVTWNGKTGYVTDAYIYTGTNSAVASGCSSAPPPASSRESKAVSWAYTQINLKSTAYNGWCERFVENAYGTSLRYRSALIAFNSLKSAGKMSYSKTNIPAGALVFSRNPYDGGDGHVILSLGKGKFANPLSTVRETTSPTGGINGATFLGWAPAPSNWPGR
ncbi:MAG: SH3 domain-containing protein [Leucobacter sp.]